MKTYTPSFHPPLTLGRRERALLDVWPVLARSRFEVIAGRLEFLEGKSTHEAEAMAFESVTRELAAET